MARLPTSLNFISDNILFVISLSHIIAIIEAAQKKTTVTSSATVAVTSGSVSIPSWQNQNQNLNQNQNQNQNQNNNQERVSVQQTVQQRAIEEAEAKYREMMIYMEGE